MYKILLLSFFSLLLYGCKVIGIQNDKIYIPDEQLYDLTQDEWIKDAPLNQFVTYFCSTYETSPSAVGKKQDCHTGRSDYIAKASYLDRTLYLSADILSSKEFSVLEKAVNSKLDRKNFTVGIKMFKQKADEHIYFYTQMFDSKTDVKYPYALYGIVETSYNNKITIKIYGVDDQKSDDEDRLATYLKQYNKKIAKTDSDKLSHIIDDENQSNKILGNKEHLAALIQQSSPLTNTVIFIDKPLHGMAEVLGFNRIKHSVDRFISRTLVGATAEGNIWSVFLEPNTDDAYFTYASGKTFTAKWRIIDENNICFDFHNDDGTKTNVCKTLSSAGRGYQWLTKDADKASSQIILTVKGKIIATKNNLVSKELSAWKGGLIVGRILDSQKIWYLRLAENGESTYIGEYGGKSSGRYQIKNNMICIEDEIYSQQCLAPTERNGKLLWIEDRDKSYHSEVLYVFQNNKTDADKGKNNHKNGRLKISDLSFPDRYFERCIRLMRVEYVDQLTTLNCSAMKIKSSEGLEYLSALTTLDLSRNKLKHIDLINNTALTTLNLSSNELSHIDVTKNTALTTLDLGHNKLASIDVTNNSALTTLYLRVNKFTNVEVTNNTALITLDLTGNNLTHLDVTNNKALKTLGLRDNKLTNIDVTKNRALTKLLLNSNQLINIDIANNVLLLELNLKRNQLTGINVKSNTALIELELSKNKLANIDVKNNTKLVKLNLGKNKLTIIDLTKNKLLTTLYLHQNKLTSIDVTNNTALTALGLSQNKLSDINVTDNKALRWLNLQNNQLTRIDLTHSSELKTLSLGQNKLTNIDLKKTILLKKLYLRGNKLTDINLKKNSELRRVFLDPTVSCIGKTCPKLSKVEAALIKKSSIDLTVPKMIKIPAGQFQMGCVVAKDCSASEKPVHTVKVSSFEMGATEVTFDQWDACVAGKGCSYSPPDEGWGRGNRPVINVSFDDIQTYLNWLNTKGQGKFQLPSEAQWEYAARAGTKTMYTWGNNLGNNNTNCRQEHCHDQYKKTAPVASFKPNAFGLYDTHGNVSEWTQDCWNKSYEEAGNSDKANLEGRCGTRFVRGGSFYGTAISTRAANRNFESRDHRESVIGFRIAKSIKP